MPGPLVTVVGVGADGLTARTRELVATADVVLGGERHLAMLPPIPSQTRETWPSPLREGLTSLLDQYAGQRVVALASGDPMLFGIGTTLVDLLGADHVEVHPAVSSVALACARMGWATDSVVVLRDHRLLPRELAPGRRIVVLSADESTPAAVRALVEGTVTVLGDLGSEAETRDAEPTPRLNVVCIEVTGAGTSWAPGLPDDAYEHDGQLTKRDLRASALSRLAPAPGQILWDVGAGAGSVGIEWMRAHATCRAIAVEQSPERAERIARNAQNLGVPDLEVVTGSAPEALAGLPTPDAVFVGGGVTRAVLDACPAASRLVVHGVTLETERLLAEMHAEQGGELTRISVEHAEPLGSYTGWKPARAVTQWTRVP